jgi:hypothetical protein
MVRNPETLPGRTITRSPRRAPRRARTSFANLFESQPACPSRRALRIN